MEKAMELQRKKDIFITRMLLVVAREDTAIDSLMKIVDQATTNHL
jgi:hypothetical protein